MKRLIATLTAMLLFCGMCLLSACGGSVAETPNGTANNSNQVSNNDQPVDLYTVVKNATEKTLAATSYEVKSVYIMDTDIFGMEMKTTADMVMKYHGKEVGIEGKSIVEMAGSKTETPCQYYYDGEYLYMSMMGENYKMAITEAEFAEETGSTSEYIAVLPKELFEGVSGDADNIVLTLDDATLKNLYGDAIGEEIGEDLSDITIKDGKITISVKDGYLTTFNVEYTCEIVSDEETMIYALSQLTEFVRYGDVTITPMEGYEDFEAVDDDFLFSDEDITFEDEF